MKNVFLILLFLCVSPLLKLNASENNQISVGIKIKSDQEGSFFGWKIKLAAGIKGDRPDLFVSERGIADEKGLKKGKVSRVSTETGQRYWSVDSQDTYLFGYNIQTIQNVSQPKSTDLIVMGAQNYNDYQEKYQDTAIVALDGISGKTIWKNVFKGRKLYDDGGVSIVGDMDNDGISEIAIVDSEADKIKFLSGKTGKLVNELNFSGEGFFGFNVSFLKGTALTHGSIVTFEEHWDQDKRSGFQFYDSETLMPTHFVGHECLIPTSRFFRFYLIRNVGDINGDGFEDVAVGGIDHNYLGQKLPEDSEVYFLSGKTSDQLYSSVSPLKNFAAFDSTGNQNVILSGREEIRGNILYKLGVQIISPISGKILTTLNETDNTLDGSYWYGNEVTTMRSGDLLWVAVSAPGGKGTVFLYKSSL